MRITLGERLRSFGRGVREHLRKNRPWIFALLATALLNYDQGWNAAIGSAFEAGMQQACPRIEHHDGMFLVRNAEERGTLNPSSTLAQELREYDYLRANAESCSFK